MKSENSIDEKTYHSQIDVWLMILMSLSISGATAWLIDLEGTYTLKGALFSLALLTFNIVLPLWILIRCHYKIDQSNNSLVIGFGPVTWYIPFESISQVSISNELSLSPALSLQRLKIIYGQNRVILISPKEVASFSDELRGMISPEP